MAFWWGGGGGGGLKFTKISFHVFFAFYAISQICMEKLGRGGGGWRMMVFAGVGMGVKNQVLSYNSIIKARPHNLISCGY